MLLFLRIDTIPVFNALDTLGGRAIIVTKSFGM